MEWIPSKLNGAWLIKPTRIEDDRGFFARTWDADSFRDRGLCTDWNQNSLSFNHHAGTLRGMHWQVAPYEEAKLVRCTQGKIIDVLLDLRADSKTYLQNEVFEITSENGYSVYIPEGIAHGFQTLADNSEVAYQISKPYRPEAARVARWNDPAFGIEWPLPISRISERDANAEFFDLSLEAQS